VSAVRARCKGSLTHVFDANVPDILVAGEPRCRYCGVSLQDVLDAFAALEDEAVERIEEDCGV